ncbi:DUF7426 family protein [Nocardia asteroides]|uniref:DUF7426 family protein n=1 Tax=Nocardia asteroides TaxID=1824 RepID=UPI0033D64925
MSEYRDLTEFYDPDLVLPIGGTEYRIKSPGIAEADRLRMIALTDLDAETEQAEIAKILGPARDQMAANGVPDTMALHAGRTAILHFGASPLLGQQYWSSGELLKGIDLDTMRAAAAPHPNRAARRRKPRRRPRKAARTQ